MNQFGCYAVFANDTCLYVGKSMNLLQRIKTHKRKYKGVATNIILYDMTDNPLFKEMSAPDVIRCVDYEETRLIDLHNPRDNNRKTEFNFSTIEKLPMAYRRLIMNKLPDLVLLDT
jgi:hypothetical protein